MKRVFHLLAALLLAAPAARAQDDPGMSMFNSYNQMAVNMSLVDVNNAAVMAAGRNAMAGKRGFASTTTTTSRSVNLAYTPSATLRQQLVQDMGRKLQASNPAAGQAFANALGPGKADYDQLFGEMVKASGLPANNAATALAAYLEVGYAIVNDVQDDKSITPAMDQGLQRQAASLLSGNRSLTSSAAVARLGEEMKLQTVLLYLGWQSVRKSGQTAQFRSNIAQQFRQKGLDMSLLRLTTQGLVKK